MTILRVGLIGANISRTRLPAALQIMCDNAGIALDFTPIDTEDIDGFDFESCVEDLVAEGWTGVTVTHPHKTQAAVFAGGGMDESVRRLGASNTLVFTDRITGWNTDYLGFLAAWNAVFGDHNPGRVAMAGAGGVARALAPALVELGAKDIAIWDPAEGKAEALVHIAGPIACAVTINDAREMTKDADGLVNATTLGMGGHAGSAFADDLIGPQKWAFDAVYTPTDTQFLKAAKRAGLEILSGFDLFRFMAMETFRTFTGLVPDTNSTLRKLDALRPGETA